MSIGANFQIEESAVMTNFQLTFPLKSFQSSPRLFQKVSDKTEVWILVHAAVLACGNGAGLCLTNMSDNHKNTEPEPLNNKDHAS